MEFRDEFIGVYHDGTTHSGESFAIVFRTCGPDFTFRLRVARVMFLRGSMSVSADQISSCLIDTIASHMRLSVSNVPSPKPR
mmetsp:Transcript_2893/g.8575  ORF Transcript_2893/g.8575 Transcript_2893/m.8575 type:complete len:82 (-) Transcript_2893:270-515(-)